MNIDKLREVLNGVTGNLIALSFVAVYLYRQLAGLDVDPELTAATLGIAGIYFAGRAVPAVLNRPLPPPPAPMEEYQDEPRDLLKEARQQAAQQSLSVLPDGANI